MRILFLGGTRYFGKLILRKLVEEQHEVFVVSRKKSEEKNIQSIIGEREDASTLLSIKKNLPYDIIIDNIAYKPQQIEKLFETVKGFLLYILTSTSAVYIDEYFPLNIKSYGLLKIACENFVKESGFPYLILRLPFVTGPNDFSGRLLYYINRIKNGIVIVPENAKTLQQVYSEDIPNIWSEACSRFEIMCNKEFNVTPLPIEIETYLSIIASVMKKQYKIFKTNEISWKIMKSSFPYIYNHVMEKDSFEQFFSYKLTPMNEFLYKTVEWYKERIDE
ncbi:MAG: hypothetical protein HQK79_04075 [Desulfobacterales bacterium]|nr:hypothetical protein [Desulfobacterales bacterium]